MKILRKYFTIFLVILTPSAIISWAEEMGTPEWWNKDIALSKIRIEYTAEQFGDAGDTGYNLIYSIKQLGFPFNCEYVPLISILSSENTDVSGNPKNNIFENKYRTWQSLETKTGNAKAGEILNHYVSQTENLKIVFERGQVVILPLDSEGAIAESVYCSPKTAKLITLDDFTSLYAKELLIHDAGFSRIVVGNNQEYMSNKKFDLDFSGGSLYKLLTAVTSALSENDNDYVYTWSISGVKGYMRHIGFHRKPKIEIESLLVDRNGG